MSAEKHDIRESHRMEDISPELNQNKRPRIDDEHVERSETAEEIDNVFSLEEKDNPDDYDDNEYDQNYEYDDESDIDDYCQFPWRFGSKSSQIKLEEIKNMLKMWKDGKTKIIATMGESVELLEEIKDILAKSNLYCGPTALWLAVFMGYE